MINSEKGSFHQEKDSCDGSGLNTIESSKGSCPLFRLGWVVMLSNFHRRSGTLDSCANSWFYLTTVALPINLDFLMTQPWAYDQLLQSESTKSLILKEIYSSFTQEHFTREQVCKNHGHKPEIYEFT